MTNWRVSIIKKADLKPDQTAALDRAAAASRSDPGPAGCWDDPICFPMLRAIVEITSGEPIGLFHIGGPPNLIDVGWWLRPEFREKQYIRDALYLLADTLIAEGATGLIKIEIRDVDYARSAHLRDKFGERFYAGLAARNATTGG